MGLVASLLKKYDVIPIFGIVPITSSTLLINNTFLSSYQVCVCVNSLCIQQHVHTTHVWDVVREREGEGEGGRGRGREREREGEGEGGRGRGREREREGESEGKR